MVSWGIGHDAQMPCALWQVAVGPWRARPLRKHDAPDARGKTATATAKANVEVWKNPSRKASCSLHDLEYVRARRVPKGSDYDRHSQGVRFPKGRRTGGQKMQGHLA
jgi:hypothetical protein